MRCFRALFLVVFALVLGAAVCMAADVAPPELLDLGIAAPVAPAASVPAAAPVSAPAAVVQPAGILAQILAFLNSSAGLAAIGTVVAFVLGKIFTAKPEWKVVYDKYQPILMTLVKEAEKAIPDTTNNAALARADYVLKKIIALEPSLSTVPTAAISAAITMAHADAEANDNI